MKQQNFQTKKTREITGLVLLALAVFLAVAYYLPGARTGALGVFFLRIGRGLFGPLAYALPVLLVYCALEIWLEKQPVFTRMRMLNVLVLSFLLSALLHIATIDLAQLVDLAKKSGGEAKATLFLQKLWLLSADPMYVPHLASSFPGGIFGGLPAVSLQALAGQIGAYILIILGIIIELVLIFNLSLSALMAGLFGRTKEVYRQVRDSDRQAASERGEQSRFWSRLLQEDENNLPWVEEEKEQESGSLSVLLHDDSTYESIQFPEQSVEGGEARILNFKVKSESDISPLTPAERTKFLQGGQSRFTERNEQHWSFGSASGTSRTVENKQPLASGLSSFILPDAKHDVDDGEDEDEVREVVHPVKIEKILSLSETWMEQEDVMLASESEDTWEPGMELYPAPTRIHADENKEWDSPAEIHTESLPASDIAQDIGDHFVDEAMDHEDIDEMMTEPETSVHEASAIQINPTSSHGHTAEQRLTKQALPQPYQFPQYELLRREQNTSQGNGGENAQQIAHKLEEALLSFGVKAKVINVTRGPSITRFELSPAPGVKVSKIQNLADDIALNLAAVSIRIEAPIPGKAAIGIEIPNKEPQMVGLRELLEHDSFRSSKAPLLVALGRDIPGQPVYCDLRKMPHMMIAGATGSGKSVCINAILMSLLYHAHPDDVKLLLIDPKVVELKVYNGIPHLLAPVVTDPKKAANTLNWAVVEMDRRYNMFADVGARDYSSYAQVAKERELERLPLVLIIVDELADLMMTAANEVEGSIARLAAKARAAGIHLIIATQRPSVDVITGVIKANIPSRIAFAVSSQIDSRTILDSQGAEKLLGRGDMLYNPQNFPKSQRAQGAFVSDAEVEAVVSFLKAQNYTSYDQQFAERIVSTSATGASKEKDAEEQDELFDQAVEIILDAGYASVSILQRRMNIGYPRAARLIDSMESAGIIGPFEGSKPRKVRITRAQWQNRGDAEEKADV